MYSKFYFGPNRMDCSSFIKSRAAPLDETQYKSHRKAALE